MKYFITAIDTNIGKTVVSAILAKAFNYPYWKPIQSGDLDNSDTMKILKLSPNIECYDEAYRLEFPLSPHESARLSKVKLNFNEIKVPSNENLIIEGAGGIMVPLNDKNLVIDIAKIANAEIILVIKHYLGSINHTLLSINYLQRNDYTIKGIIIVGDRLESSERAIKEHTGLDILYNFEHTDVIDKNYIEKQAIKIKNDIKRKR
jgi:dethiobiotin synthetase